jgi:uncharacterized protein YrzB (UPF0473 family)
VYINCCAPFFLKILQIFKKDIDIIKYRGIIDDMNYEFEQINDIINASKGKILELFEQFDTYIQSSQKLIKDYNIANNSNFNIFSSISDIYYRENFHSDIIKLILDPLTEKIGNEKNIQLFIKMLKKKNPALKILIGKNYIVEREKGRIDVLLYDENNNAILVENKINFAGDQDDQLGRYYLKITNSGLTVNAIVYLTLTPDKILDIAYSIKNEELRRKIKDLIIPISVINKNKEINFSDDFIGECIKYSENDISKVYYSEYQELITHLGGNAMTMDLDRDAIKDIYTNKEKLVKFNLFGNLWDKRWNVINEIIKEQLKENDFQPHPDDKNTLFCKLDENVSLAYHLKDWSLGFTYTPEAKKFSEVQNDLKNILDNKKLKDIFYKDPADSNEYWTWKTINIDKIGNFDNIITNFKILEELYKGK